MLFFYFTLLLLLLGQTNALPMTSKMKTMVYQQNAEPFTASTEDWYTSREYDVYSNLVEHYENLVDSTLNAESEELLLNLIHLPRQSMNLALTSQAALLGFDALTEKQLIKMPSIIGKHIQAMNAEVFNSIEPTIKLFWRTIWDPNMLSVEEQNEDYIMSFLSSFNGVIAKKLMDQMDDYHLLEHITHDLVSIGALGMDTEQGCNDILWRCLFKKLPSRQTTTKLTKIKLADLETDFLRQHLSDLRTSLLMSLHVQFMDFYVRIQSDIMDTLSLYYNDAH